MRSALPHLVALALGGAAAVLVSCGASNRLIPATSARQLDNHLQDVSNAVAARNCVDAVNAMTQVQTDVAQLKGSIDVRLRLRLQFGANRLAGAVPRDCALVPTTATTTATTAPPTTTTTPPETTTTTETPPTTTTTPTQTDTGPTIPTIPGDTTGGVGVPR